LALARYRIAARGPLSGTVFVHVAAPSIEVGAASLSFFLSLSLPPRSSARGPS
jgi:spermidine/putrescine transport system permease protein